MLVKIVCWLLATAALTAAGQRLMAFFLERNRDSLAEYQLEPGPVCSNITLALGTALTLFLGYVVPVSVAGRVLSCFLLYWLWLLWLIDYRFQFIFDDSLLPLLLVALAATPYLPEPVWQRLTAGAGAFAVLAALSLLSGGALGGGDVKLMGVLGLWFGVNGIITTACVGFILGGIAAIVMLVLHKRGRKDYFAFGPFLILGALVAWLSMALLIG